MKSLKNSNHRGSQLEFSSKGMKATAMRKVHGRAAGGIKGVLLREARVATMPSTAGECEVCGGDGHVRYFVAAKLPRFLYLCDEDYLRIRERLEQSLKEILREDMGLE